MLRIVNMPPLFPGFETFQQTFGNTVLSVSRPQNELRSRSTPYQARPELYSAYSVVDDAKNKAQKLSNEAVKEFEVASQKAQQKAGKIELFSGKYYAACTFGGMLACVRVPFHRQAKSRR